MIDTNVVIDYFEDRLPATNVVWLEQIIDEELSCISIINYIELFSFKSSPDDVAQLRDFTNRCSLIRLSDEIAEQTALLRQEVKIKLPDAVIAATALTYDLTLVTRNTPDFKNIPGLTVVNPHAL